MTIQDQDLVSALPHLIEAAEQYRSSGHKLNADITEVTRTLVADWAAHISAINSLRGLNLDITEMADFRSPDDVARVLDSLRVTLRDVRLAAVI